MDRRRYPPPPQPPTLGAGQVFAMAIDLPTPARDAIVTLLNRQLVDTLNRFGDVRQAHWNVKGRQFFQLHLLFDDITERLADAADLIAERAAAMGGLVTGTARLTPVPTRLPELPAGLADGPSYVRALVERGALVAASTRAGIDEAAAAGDTGTADMLTEISRRLDKDVWFLQAHLQA